jgi:hypothetical protein
MLAIKVGVAYHIDGGALTRTIETHGTEST